MEGNFDNAAESGVAVRINGKGQHENKQYNVLVSMDDYNYLKEKHAYSAVFYIHAYGDGDYAASHPVALPNQEGNVVFRPANREALNDITSELGLFQRKAVVMEYESNGENIKTRLIVDYDDYRWLQKIALQVFSVKFTELNNKKLCSGEQNQPQITIFIAIY